MKNIITLLGFIASILSHNACSFEKTDIYLVIGSYSSPTEKGIHVFTFNEENGENALVSETEGITNPSYLVQNSDGKRIYCVSETEDETSSLYAYAFNHTNGTIKFINSKPTHGTAPCHVWVAPSDKLAITANYNEGSISIFPITNSGSLQDANVEKYEGGTPNSKRQSCPHLHCIYSSPDGKYVYANDLGTDRIYKYRMTMQDSTTYIEKSIPSYFQLPAGEGPRHAEFHPNGKYAYIIGELSGNITVMALKEEGNLAPIQTISADSLHAAGSADIHISPNGKYLYASNRLQGDGIAIFSIDKENGHLKKVGYQTTGTHPRNFAITPNGKFLLCACRDDNKIQIFHINPNNGMLHATGKEIHLSQPVCLKFIKK